MLQGSTISLTICHRSSYMLFLSCFFPIYCGSCQDGLYDAVFSSASDGDATVFYAKAVQGSGALTELTENNPFTVSHRKRARYKSTNDDARQTQNNSFTVNHHNELSTNPLMILDRLASLLKAVGIIRHR